MGDGFIAEFSSVVDAVTFAVAMQKSAPERQQGTAPEKRLVYRIGINLGDVVVDGDDLLGDGVNVAARLEQICKPRGILISGTAYDQLQGKLGLPLDFTGEQQVKNINRSVRTYAVRLDGSAPGWSRALPRYVKRARPMIAGRAGCANCLRRKLVVCAPRRALVCPVHRRHAVRGRGGRRRGDRSPRSGHR
jgi:Adenylate and Guanylate cyclase catalytic domain